MQKRVLMYHARANFSISCMWNTF